MLSCGCVIKAPWFNLCELLYFHLGAWRPWLSLRSQWSRIALEEETNIISLLSNQTGLPMTEV